MKNEEENDKFITKIEVNRTYRDLLSAFGLGTKKVKQILSKEDVSDEDKLNSLLAEEDTLAECKSSNAQLIEFLSKPEILTKLIHYATRFPQNISSKD